MSHPMWYIVLVIILILFALSIIHFVRRQIARSREELKHVDRSKLRDLDHDAWSEDERHDDTP